MLAALIIGATAFAQPTPAEKRDLKNDLAKERHKRHEVARDILLGEPGKARADNDAAIAYHREIHRDIHRIHQHDVERARNRPHVVVRHHYYHHRHYRHHRHYPHHKTVVVIQH